MTANDQTVEWTPEMEIQLKNGKDKVVIKRKSNDYENDKENYRSRTITLNGQKIFHFDWLAIYPLRNFKVL